MSSFYFGYQGNLQSVKIPTTGLERTQNAFRSSGVLTNGGGWVRSSVAQHYTYQINWDFIRNEDYAKIRALYDYGELIHFLDPQAAVSNSLPPYIAQAGDAARGGYRLIGYSGLVTLSEVTTLAPLVTHGPLRTVRYSAISGAPRKSVWLPIPPGHTLHLRGLTTSSSGANIVLNTTPLPYWTTGTTIPFISVASPAAQGVALSIDAGDDITIRWLQSKVLPTGQAVTWDNWMPGLGHSGCRLDDVPSYTLYSAPQAIDFGALGLTLRETGAWE
jgi:hypothetical protein